MRRFTEYHDLKGAFGRRAIAPPSRPVERRLSEAAVRSALSVACRSTMTGARQGPLNIGPMAALPVTGTQIGRVADLWHVWDTLLLARQLGAPAPDLRVGAPT